MLLFALLYPLLLQCAAAWHILVPLLLGVVVAGMLLSRLLWRLTARYVAGEPAGFPNR